MWEEIISNKEAHEHPVIQSTLKRRQHVWKNFWKEGTVKSFWHSSRENLENHKKENSLQNLAQMEDSAFQDPFPDILAEQAAGEIWIQCQLGEDWSASRHAEIIVIELKQRCCLIRAWERVWSTWTASKVGPSFCCLCLIHTTGVRTSARFLGSLNSYLSLFFFCYSRALFHFVACKYKGQKASGGTQLNNENTPTIMDKRNLFHSSLPIWPQMSHGLGTFGLNSSRIIVKFTSCVAKPSMIKSAERKKRHQIETSTPCTYDLSKTNKQVKNNSYHLLHTDSALCSGHDLAELQVKKDGKRFMRSS